MVEFYYLSSNSNILYYVFASVVNKTSWYFLIKRKVTDLDCEDSKQEGCDLPVSLPDNQMAGGLALFHSHYLLYDDEDQGHTVTKPELNKDLIR